MKVYRIKVNGKVYEVEVELVENKDGNLTETPNKRKPCSECYRKG